MEFSRSTTKSSSREKSREQSRGLSRISALSALSENRRYKEQDVHKMAKEAVGHLAKIFPRVPIPNLHNKDILPEKKLREQKLKSRCDRQGIKIIDKRAEKKFYQRKNTVAVANTSVLAPSLHEKICEKLNFNGVFEEPRIEDFFPTIIYVATDEPAIPKLDMEPKFYNDFPLPRISERTEISTLPSREKQRNQRQELNLTMTQLTSNNKTIMPTTAGKGFWKNYV